MITPKFKTTIKEVIGGRYCPKIITHLSEKKIFNSKGEPYSTESIQKIVSGIQRNEVVETEIINFVEQTQNRQKELQAKMNKKTSL